MNKLETRIAMCQAQYKASMQRGDVAAAMNALAEQSEHQKALDNKHKHINDYYAKKHNVLTD